MTSLLWIVGTAAWVATAAEPRWASAVSQYCLHGRADVYVIGVLQAKQADREARLAVLRAKAQERISEDVRSYSDQQLREIETRYEAAHLRGTSLPDRGARQKLQELVELYPRSNRAGCAVLKLAQLSSGDERERYLNIAIAEHDDAWFENGAQVGPLARALLAMHYAGLDRLDEAERLAKEIATRYPGSVDSTGALLDEVLPGLKLLRPPK